MELISMTGQVGIGYKSRNLRDLDMQAVHHFAVDLQDFFDYPIVPEELTQEEEESVILIVDNYHNSPPERDWGGIGYSFVVFPSERVYEFGPLTQQRAGVGSHNHHVVSWCIAGDFTDNTPRSSALRAGVDLGKHIHIALGLTEMPTSAYGGYINNMGSAGIGLAEGLHIADQTGADVNRILELGPAIPYLRLEGGGAPAGVNSNVIVNFGGTLYRLTRNAGTGAVETAAI